MEKMLNSSIASRSSTRIIFTVLILIVSTAALVIYLRNREISNKIFFNEIQNRQLVLSKSGANSIELFFNSLKTNIVYISKIEAVSSLDQDQTRVIFKDFITRYKDFPFLAITRFDQNGKLIVIERAGGSTRGEKESFSDREYYLWAKNPANKDKIYISKPFIIRIGPSKGKYGIMIAVPTYFRDKFTGVASIAVVMDKFTDVFVNPYRINKSGDTFIINKGGTIISSSKSSKINTSLVNGEFAEVFAQTRQKNEGEGVTKDGVFAFSSIDDQYFLIVANTRENLILSSFWPLANNQKNWLIIILAMTITTMFILIIVDHNAHREGFLKGLTKCRKEKE